MLFVSLPWYDLKETMAPTNALWEHLASRLRNRGVRNVPDRLRREISYQEQWTSGKLLFSQACGYDVLLPFRDHLRIIATPIYQAAGCSGPWYSSAVVVREDSRAEHLEDLRGSRCVINSLTSHSGMNALRAMVAPLHCNGKFFSSVRVSSSHETSLEMIARGKADVAAIDGVTYTLLKRHRAHVLSSTRVLCHSQRVPAPPFVTSSQTTEEELQRIQAALFETLEDSTICTIKDELLLGGAEILSLECYESISEWEQEARRLGYGEIQSLCGREDYS